MWNAIVHFFCLKSHWDDYFRWLGQNYTGDPALPYTLYIVVNGQGEAYCKGGGALILVFLRRKNQPKQHFLFTRELGNDAYHLKKKKSIQKNEKKLLL